MKIQPENSAEREPHQSAIMTVREIHVLLGTYIHTFTVVLSLILSIFVLTQGFYIN